MSSKAKNIDASYRAVNASAPCSGSPFTSTGTHDALGINPHTTQRMYHRQLMITVRMLSIAHNNTFNIKQVSLL